MGGGHVMGQTDYRHNRHGIWRPTDFANRDARARFAKKTQFFAIFARGRECPKWLTERARELGQKITSRISSRMDCDRVREFLRDFLGARDTRANCTIEQGPHARILRANRAARAQIVRATCTTFARELREFCA